MNNNMFYLSRYNKGPYRYYVIIVNTLCLQRVLQCTWDHLTYERLCVSSISGCWLCSHEMQGTPVLAYSVHKWDSTGPCSSHDIYNRKQILMVETYKKKYRKYRRVLNHLYNTDILASIFTSNNLHFIYAGLTGRHTSTVPILCTHIATFQP